MPPAKDGLARARQIADLCFCSSTLHPIVTRIRIPPMFADGAEAQKSVYLKAVEMMRFNFDTIEERLAGGRWWYGDAWSAMDAYLYWVWFRVTGAGFPAADYPRLQRSCRAHGAAAGGSPRAPDRGRSAGTAGDRRLAFRPPPPPV